MSKLDKLLIDKKEMSAASLLPLYLSTQQQVNQMYFQAEEMFLALAGFVSLAAGYAFISIINP
ncbi:MAG: hypothetical protein ACP5MV_04395 [Candidatus Parvarchaeum sp.]